MKMIGRRSRSLRAAKRGPRTSSFARPTEGGLALSPSEGERGKTRWLCCASVILAAACAACSGSTQQPIAEKTPVVFAQASADTTKAKSDSAAGGLVPLPIKLPSPAFKGTPKDIEVTPYTEPYSEAEKMRPPFMVPPGLKNLAPGAKLSSSDPNATAALLAKITDGDKEPSDQSIIYLKKGAQWVQLDLGKPCEVFAILIWHAHNVQKVYHAVIVQVSDDPDFVKDVKTLFNNDQENKAGQGVGTDREYFETFQGKLINAKGAKGRYVRFYSKGSTESVLNEYTEIEVYGKPVE